MTLEEIIEAIQARPRIHLLAPGAADEELTRCEAVLSVRIPGEYWQLLRFSSGAILYETEELLGTYRVWEQAETMSEATLRLRNSATAKLPDILLPFHSGLPGRYTCFDTGSIGSSGGVVTVQWVEGEGAVSSRPFTSFGDWFKQILYDEYEGRYS